MKRKSEESASETIVFNESPRGKKEKKNSHDTEKSSKPFESNLQLQKKEIPEGHISSKNPEGGKTLRDTKPGMKFNYKGNSNFKKGKGEFKQKIALNQGEPGELDKKELRIKQKLLKRKRKEKERGYAIPDEAKKMFEELRCKKCPQEKRVELSTSLFKILSDRLPSAIRSHDLSRMVQWLIKVGPLEVKEKVIEQVIVDVIQLSKTKYSNHIVLKILKESDKSIRKRIFNNFIGNICALVRNRFSAPVVEEYYSKYAKQKAKACMRQELYSDLFRGQKNPTLRSLTDVLSQNPTLKSAILKSSKTILSKLIQKKSALETSLVSDVLLDYMQHCEEQDKLDLLEIIKSNIPILLSNKSGCKIVMHLLWESTAKVKKSIVKELKTQVLKIAKSNGNIFIRSLFDSVDDTVLIKKAILPAILDNSEELVKDSNGRKVLLYLVAHRDTAYFHPKELEELRKADESSNVKKDISVKEKELLEPCVENLLVKVKENPSLWLSEATIAVVTLAILKKGSGDKLFDAYKALSEFLVASMAEDNSKIMSDAGLQMVIKKLIKEDVVTDEENKFAIYLSNRLSIEVVDKLIESNRGCFILVHLIETNIDIISSKVRHIFNKSKMKQKLDSQDCKGAELLKSLLSK